MSTRRFIVQVDVVDGEIPAGATPNEVADQLHDALCQLDDDVLPAWLFSFDGVDPVRET